MPTLNDRSQFVLADDDLDAVTGGKATEAQTGDPIEGSGIQVRRRTDTSFLDTMTEGETCGV